jgi:hypothetical protein
MLKEGISIEVVVKVTGLGKEEVRKLKKGSKIGQSQ